MPRHARRLREVWHVEMQGGGAKRTMVPGAAFDEAKRTLYVFDPPFRILVIRAYPDLRSWECDTRRGVWRGCRPAFDFFGRLERARRRVEGRRPEPSLDDPPVRCEQLLLPFPCRPPVSTLLALRRFVDLIPTGLRTALRKYRAGHLQLLAMLARCPAAMELVDGVAAHPALAYLMAHSYLFRKGVRRPYVLASRLIRWRRRNALGFLGFPATNAAVRILAKIPQQCLRTEVLLTLRVALQRPEAVQRLCHVPRINSGCIWLAHSPELLAHVSDRVLSSVGANTREDRMARTHLILRDVVDMLGQLRPPTAVQRLRTFTRPRDIYELHDDLVAEMSEAQPVLSDLAFPDPPVPGQPERIFPLRSPRELLEEGRSMRSCVGNLAWAQRVASGEYYIYRVVQPARATVALALRDGAWGVAEIRGMGNAPAPARVTAAVREWLSSR